MSQPSDKTETGHEESRKLLRGAGMFGALSAASRGLGLLRDMALTAVLSTGARDAFLLAFSIPNMFRNLFGEGALTNSLVPLYVERIEKKDTDGANRLASLVFTALALGLGLFALLGAAGCLGASFFVNTAEHSKDHLVLQLLAVMAPFLPLVCLYAFFMALLTSHRRFAMPAFAPVLLNVAILAGAFLAWKWNGLGSEPAAYVLAASVLVGGVMMVAIQLPAAHSAGVRIKPALDLKDDAFRGVLAAMAPVLIGTGVYQLNTFLNRLFAWVLVGHGPGAEPAPQSYLALSNLLVMAPIGIVAVGLSTAALPTLSSLHARGDKKSFATTLSSALRMSLFMLIPVVTVIIVAAEPIINLLYGRGGWQPEETPHMVRVLFWSALSLPATVVTMLAARAFYAMKMPKVPARIAIVTVIVNIVLSLGFVLFGHHTAGLLEGTRLATWLAGPLSGFSGTGAQAQTAAMWFSGAAGLALASTLAGVVQMCQMLSALKRERPEVELAGTAITALRTSAMCVITGIAVYWVVKSLPPTGEGFIIVAQRGIAPVLAGIFVYTLVASLFDIDEYSECWRAIRGRGKKADDKDKKKSGGDEDDDDDDEEEEDSK